MPRKHRFKPRLTFANAVAVLALCVALGSTSLASPITHGAASVAGDVARALHLSKRSDVTSHRALSVARQALAAAKTALAKSGVPGPPGATGATGATGAPGSPGTPGTPGSAIGYATVSYCTGNCPDQTPADWYTPDEQALGVDNQANFQHPTTGTFCFYELPFHVHNVVANLGPSSDATPHNNYTVQTQVGTAPGCKSGGHADQNAVVYVRDPSGNKVDPDQSAKLLILFN